MSIVQISTQFKINPLCHLAKKFRSDCGFTGISNKCSWDGAAGCRWRPESARSPGASSLPSARPGSQAPSAQSRDFTVKDIIYLHPSTTPYPGGFKCFTCEKAADNYECNRWAPDIYCPRETRYCYTQHTMEVTGNSISVTKRCVALEECLSTGCRDSEHEGHKVCTSCCEGNICNLPLPRNETDATFATTSPINQTNGRPHCVPVIVTCLWVLLAITS
ncbi:Ly6/PLAUR domain-containing protein 6 [Manis javanica]|nr:Ly6/PLAUR domain-containing protein 6 [Manis javanica]